MLFWSITALVMKDNQLVHETKSKKKGKDLTVM